jgi:hypothetical protein
VNFNRSRLAKRKDVDRPKFQDVATFLSRSELALAFVAAALLGGLLNSLQEILPGNAPTEVKVLGALMTFGLVCTVAAWRLSRTSSLDLGACLVVRRGQLENRGEVAAALGKSSRSWLAVEVVDDIEAWSLGVPKAVQDLAQSVASPLSGAVGHPRVLLALSSSDAVGFYLGNVLKAGLLNADIQIMTLPTRSQAWHPTRYKVGSEIQREFFEVDDLSGTGCRCEHPTGIAVVDPARSPNRNSEIVIASLLSQDIVCCSEAIHVFTEQRAENEPLSGLQTVEAARFVRARCRWLANRKERGEMNVSLTMGPEASMVVGFLLAGFFAWTVREFDAHDGQWKIRWKSG